MGAAAMSPPAPASVIEPAADADEPAPGKRAPLMESRSESGRIGEQGSDVGVSLGRQSEG